MSTPRGCPACGESGYSPLTVREMMFGTGESFPYASCKGCGTVWLTEIPVDYSPYYPEDYYSVDLDPERTLGRPGVSQFTSFVVRSALNGRHIAASFSRKVLRRRQFQTFMTMLDSIALAGLARGRDSRILDVGCGSGMLVYAMSLARFGVEGLDPFAPDDRTFDTGATIRKAYLNELERSYDLVMFHHSFEHVLDPRETLIQAGSVLSDQGRILIRMPTVSSEAFDTYGADWVQLDAPRHTAVFSRAGVRRLCEDLNFEVLTVRDDSGSFQFWGSEQHRAGIAFTSPQSHFLNPHASPFRAEQIAAWDRRAAEVNAEGRGDQAVWVIRPRR